MLEVLYLLAGIALLAGGGEALIRGALGISQRLKISALLSGLVIVGFGTSMPEMVVSLDAALSGQPDIAIGNVVGSNIANILFILGLCALITPMAVTPTALNRDGLVVVGASLLMIGLAWCQALSRIDGVILMVALAGYLIWAYRSERDKALPVARVHEAEAVEVQAVPKSLAWSFGAIMVGLAALIGGSQVLLKGAVGIAELLSVPKAVVGLTLVAVGTSLPELTISVMAAIRRHADVAVGNILGSNIFNLLGILGISAATQPLALSGRVAAFDQWVMLGVAVVLMGMLYSGRRLGRIEGAVLLLGYIAYVTVSYIAL
ncbi:Sodium/potassium/calcium exchanger [Saliniradius amylolyticus]|uniref:Sodium/potassium/calcium exchanger n=1 Tax=Saliniradius amylolyticus TaxID=2183582 RepID=A0A2S2DZK0_9ALTE|nr:calcium/sodium antiporter [Saliniradius amylolyticus]AWL10712.1 Sodium/potassium/calcium exchanger [Saliniradius amylolyticus]